MKYAEGSVKNSDSMGRSKYVNYSLKKKNAPRQIDVWSGENHKHVIVDAFKTIVISKFNIWQDLF